MKRAPVIELSGVTVDLGGKRVLEDVSLTVEEGDFYAVIGPNGGGKSTLLKTVLGLVRLAAGDVKVLGGRPQERRHLLGYVPQYRTFDFSYPVTVGEMVLSGRLGHLQGFPRRYGRKDHEMADEALELMGIADLAGREISRLSGGQQQRAIIARALAAGPRVLILDEPTVYIDSPTEDHFMKTLDTLREQMTIVFVTHDIGVLSSRVTKVACLNRRLYTHESPELTSDMIEAAYGCPVDLIAHGVPHRVFPEHRQEGRR
ncbi:metal ABC transporter ATP-binding protein [Methanofollis formosanus]|uniref:Metal ABC transporter ATP-binding protein n=1 Tax=Methanofollis formosanus TaxID=299308 RepID=A0A8G1EGN3_9EURY|nr:metal ABC transporter ATP-binding protein [Methanofollis formosanus]QYZ79349.1 metal ABC transporter ATP-binding protein [Methanofollis formosanus]